MQVVKKQLNSCGLFQDWPSQAAGAVSMSSTVLTSQCYQWLHNRSTSYLCARKRERSSSYSLMAMWSIWTQNSVICLDDFRSILADGCTSPLLEVLWKIVWCFWSTNVFVINFQEFSWLWTLVTLGGRNSPRTWKSNSAQWLWWCRTDRSSFV